MAGAVRLAVDLVAALLIAGVVAVLVAPLSIGLPIWLGWALTLGLAAMGATLGAAWASNLLSGQASGARFSPLLGMSLVAALLGVWAIISFTDQARPEGSLLAGGVAFTALAATLAAESFRHRRHTLGGDLAASLGVVALGTALLLGTLWAAPRLSDFLRDSPQILLSPEEEQWCDRNVVQVLWVADELGFAARGGAPRVEEPGRHYDPDAVTEWRTRRPGDYQRSCRQAYTSR